MQLEDQDKLIIANELGNTLNVQLENAHECIYKVYKASLTLGLNTELIERAMASLKTAQKQTEYLKNFVTFGTTNDNIIDSNFNKFLIRYKKEMEK